MAPKTSQNPGDYTGLLVTQDYAGAAEAFVQVFEMLTATGYVALADELRGAWLTFNADIRQIAEDTANMALVEIVKEERQSRVRPDTNGDGGRRMEDFLGFSGALTAVPGSVGINYEPLLEANVPWWWTNEEGFSGHVGRVVHGFFYDAGWTGASAPSGALSREHPLFRAEGPQRDSNTFGPDHDWQDPQRGGKGERPGMMIRNPIPARRFVEKGYQSAEYAWHIRMQTAKARFNRSLDRINARLGVPQP